MISHTNYICHLTSCVRSMTSDVCCLFCRSGVAGQHDELTVERRRVDLPGGEQRRARATRQRRLQGPRLPRHHGLQERAARQHHTGRLQSTGEGSLVQRHLTGTCSLASRRPTVAAAPWLQLSKHDLSTFASCKHSAATVRCFEILLPKLIKS